MKESKADLFGYIAPSPAEPKPRTKQAQLGQYLTSEAVATFMARLFPALPSETRLIDAGAGAGALTTAFAEQWRTNGAAGRLTTHAYELDEPMLAELQRMATILARSGVQAEIFSGDFIGAAAKMLRFGTGPRYTHAILNPPYKKIGTASDYRGYLRLIGLETVNLYSGFVGATLELLENGGELVAIIPRSFCNGPYYQPFRRFVLSRAAIRHIHLFESRNKAFKGDGVLQENVIIRLTRGAPQGEVIVSTSADDTFSDYLETPYAFESIVYPNDEHQFIHIPTGNDAELLASITFGFRLDQLGLSVSTGPVVDFRMRDDLRADPERGTVPLLYPGHFSSEGLSWPKPGFKKANAIRYTRETAKWLYPTGFYAVVRRFSSKEEKRRIVANVVEPAALQGDMIGFENHLNVFHENKRPLSEDMARGLTVYLNTTSIDQYFRRFNGHTQVNATDLRNMPYPSREALLALGAWAKRHPQPSQDDIDARVAEAAA